MVTVIPALSRNPFSPLSLAFRPDVLAPGRGRYGCRHIYPPHPFRTLARRALPRVGIKCKNESKNHKMDSGFRRNDGSGEFRLRKERVGFRRRTGTGACPYRFASIRAVSVGMGRDLSEALAGDFERESGIRFARTAPFQAISSACRLACLHPARCSASGPGLICRESTCSRPSNQRQDAESIAKRAPRGAHPGPGAICARDGAPETGSDRRNVQCSAAGTGFHFLRQPCRF